MQTDSILVAVECMREPRNLSLQHFNVHVNLTSLNVCHLKKKTLALCKFCDYCEDIVKLYLQSLYNTITILS